MAGRVVEWVGGWKALSVIVVMDTTLFLQTFCVLHLVVCYLPPEPARQFLFVSYDYYPQV